MHLTWGDITNDSMEQHSRRNIGFLLSFISAVSKKILVVIPDCGCPGAGTLVASTAFDSLFQNENHAFLYTCTMYHTFLTCQVVCNQPNFYSGKAVVGTEWFNLHYFCYIAYEKSVLMQYCECNQWQLLKHILNCITMITRTLEMANDNWTFNLHPISLVEWASCGIYLLIQWKSPCQRDW